MPKSAIKVPVCTVIKSVCKEDDLPAEFKKCCL